MKCVWVQCINLSLISLLLEQLSVVWVSWFFWQCELQFLKHVLFQDHYVCVILLKMTM